MQFENEGINGPVPNRSARSWQHTHDFSVNNAENEKNTLRVIILTTGMMVLEIAAGTAFGSMALLADGWHMSTHAAALGITLLAYIFARRLAGDRRFAFGTGKMGVLGGFSSAVVLLVVALMMAFEAIQRLLAPRPILYNEAILVAVLGLGVNLFSAYLLRDHHDHGHHEHDEPHEHDHEGHEDHNLKAAYLHVLADALTSVLAIAALLAGKALGWGWMDAVMGLVGAAVISRWSIGLLRDTGAILLDQTGGEAIHKAITSRLESDPGTCLVDLHVWKISSSQYAAALILESPTPLPVDEYRHRLAGLDEVVHVTVEVHKTRLGVLAN